MVRWCFPYQIVWISQSLSCFLFPSLSLTLSLYPFLSPSFALCTHYSTHRKFVLYIYNTNFFHKMKYDLKGHMRPLLCRVIFESFQIFWSNYNFDLCSYGQLLSLLLRVYAIYVLDFNWNFYKSYVDIQELFNKSSIMSCNQVCVCPTVYMIFQL